MSHQEMDEDYTSSKARPKRQPSESSINLLREQLASNDDAEAEAGVKLLKQLINLGFEIPSSVTDIMVERQSKTPTEILDVAGPDSEMVEVLNQLGIEIPAYEELPSDDDIPCGD